ncbi:MAG: trimethylamine methyltransferase family protein, partial [Gammaproteobacteria bacterium]
MNRRSRRGRHHGVADTSHRRQVDYRKLKNPLLRQPAFSEDRLEAIHRTALRVIEELGIKVLNDEARDYFKQAGASVDETSQLVRIDPALIVGALESAPSEFTLYGSVPEADVTLGGDNIAFTCVGGAPHISDLDRGKR